MNSDATPTECAQCGRVLTEQEDQIEASGRTFCRSCFEELKNQLQEAISAQGEEIDYPRAALGAVLGAAAGAAVWWGFTIVTGIAFGLVAIVIGFATGKGTVMFSGGKRSRGLQALSTVVATLGFAYSSYLVNRTFLLESGVEQGVELDLPLLPEPSLLIEVVSLSFGIMDLVFLAIVVYEAWRIPAPFRLEGLSDV